MRIAFERKSTRAKTPPKQARSRGGHNPQRHRLLPIHSRTRYSTSPRAQSRVLKPGTAKLPLGANTPEPTHREPHKKFVAVPQSGLDHTPRPQIPARFWTAPCDCRFHFPHAHRFQTSASLVKTRRNRRKEILTSPKRKTPRTEKPQIKRQRHPIRLIQSYSSNGPTVQNLKSQFRISNSRSTAPSRNSTSLVNNIVGTDGRRF
jgi:hypothetical protein